MCKAHVLRFSCGHGILMSIEPCNLGPCPMLKSTGIRLPPQPYRCYNCEQRRNSVSNKQPTLPGSRSSSSIGSMDSALSSSSSEMSFSTSPKLSRMATAPLPGASCIQYGQNITANMNRTRSMSTRSFSFSCSSSNHFPTPHYSNLPAFLPHQDHPCPPCQIENLRCKGEREAVTEAKTEYPSLKGEALVRNGLIREEWQTKVPLERYVAEKLQEERDLWFHVARKWTQDLKRARVLIAEEDGLGLMMS